jgi:uncharacterized protein DUF397
VEVQSTGSRVDLSGATWRKSTRSGPNCDNCVEVAFVPAAVAVRDSKDPRGPVLVFATDGWSAFVGDAAAGRFDR